MNEEIFEENIVDTINEDNDNTNMDNTFEEIETSSEVDEVDTVESILSLLEQRLLEDRLNEDEEDTLHSTTSSGVAAEDVPVNVQNVNEVDYTDLLVSIDSKLDTLLYTESGVLVNSSHGIYTPLNDYTLSELFMVFGLLGFGVYCLVSFIKNI